MKNAKPTQPQSVLPSNDPENWLSTRQAAEMMGLTARQMREHAQDRNLDRTQEGNSNYFRREVILAEIDRRRGQPGQQEHAPEDDTAPAPDGQSADGDEQPTWLTREQGAAIFGVSPTTFVEAARKSGVERKPDGSSFLYQRRSVLEAQERRKAETARRMQELRQKVQRSPRVQKDEAQAPQGTSARAGLSPQSRAILQQVMQCHQEEVAAAKVRTDALLVIARTVSRLA